MGFSRGCHTLTTKYQSSHSKLWSLLGSLIILRHLIFRVLQEGIHFDNRSDSFCSTRCPISSSTLVARQNLEGFASSGPSSQGVGSHGARTWKAILAESWKIVYMQVAMKYCGRRRGFMGVSTSGTLWGGLGNLGLHTPLEPPPP